MAVLSQRFKERLRLALELSGVSQSELARRVGVDRQAISNYLAGRLGNPTLETVESMALALHLHHHALIDESDLEVAFHALSH